MGGLKCSGAYHLQMPRARDLGTWLPLWAPQVLLAGPPTTSCSPGLPGSPSRSRAWLWSPMHLLHARAVRDVCTQWNDRCIMWVQTQHLTGHSFTEKTSEQVYTRAPQGLAKIQTNYTNNQHTTHSRTAPRTFHNWRYTDPTNIN